MPRILAGGRRDTKLGTTPSGKSVWLEKRPGDYKGWSASDHLYAAVLHDANRTRGGSVAEAHRALAGKGASYSQGRQHSSMPTWRTRVFNTHHAAQGFLNRIKKRHVAVIEAHGASQWRVAYLPEGKGMPLNE